MKIIQEPGSVPSRRAVTGASWLHGRVHIVRAIAPSMRLVVKLRAKLRGISSVQMGQDHGSKLDEV